ncbi:MAG: glutamate-5-semialdehyde dehydrogenase [Clostridia bacterium]|nr:glutamate-5-semialdehyde dehydrogenase [Clostridia bacterium]
MDIFEYVKDACTRAAGAKGARAGASTALRTRVLLRAAELLLGENDAILAENKKDLARAAENGVPSVMLDRLCLTEERIAGIADALRAVAALPDPTGAGDTFTRPNGLRITRLRVPLGVVGMIYEARPNVTVDAAALCIKTGNAVVLRGGKEALFSNMILATLLRRALTECDLPADAVILLERTEREGVAAMKAQRGLLDVLIPRGGHGLIRAVTDGSAVPVIETGAGNCHVYVDAAADIDMALRVCENAKLSRPSVCNAAETLLVHSAIAAEFLLRFRTLTGKRLELRGCNRTCALIPGITRATDEDYATEYDDAILAVRVVDSVEEAVAHINRYNTGHSEAILTNDINTAEYFRQSVDAAAVYVNASTRFTDGGEFGFGAEIGISTQKLHVRGPMGLSALTTEKYFIDGNGQIR